MDAALLIMYNTLYRGLLVVAGLVLLNGTGCLTATEKSAEPIVIDNRFMIDLNKDGVNDFSIFKVGVGSVAGGYASKTVYIGGISHTQIVANRANSIDKSEIVELAKGILIGPYLGDSLTWVSDGILCMGGGVGDDRDYPWECRVPTGEKIFFGLRIGEVKNPSYGWVKISINTDSASREEGGFPRLLLHDYRIASPSESIAVGANS